MKRFSLLSLLWLVCLAVVAQPSQPRLLSRPLTPVPADSVMFMSAGENWRTMALAADPALRPAPFRPVSPADFSTQAKAWEARTADSLNLVGGTGDELRQPQLASALHTLHTSASLFLASGDGRYMEAAERALMNAVAAGAAPDRPTAERRAAGEALIAAPSLIYATDAEGLYVNLFVNSYAIVRAAGFDGAVDQVTDMPATGVVVLRLRPRANSSPMTLRLRLPGWGAGRVVPEGRYAAEGAQPLPEVYINGKEALASSVEGGYLTVRRKWNRGDEVRLVFPLPVLSVRSVEDGAARRGRVALTRGPLTYVAAKPGAGLHLSDSVPPQPDYTINYTGFVPLAGRLDPDTPQAGSSATAGVALKAVPYAYASQLLKGRLTLWLPERS